MLWQRWWCRAWRSRPPPPAWWSHTWLNSTEDDDHTRGWSSERKEVWSVCAVLIFKGQHAFACKGKDRSYDSGKFILFENWIIMAKKSRIFVVNPLCSDGFLMQGSKAWGSSWIEESIPWSPQLPNKSFFCKARLGRLTKGRLPWAAPEPPLPAGPQTQPQETISGHFGCSTLTTSQKLGVGERIKISRNICNFYKIQVSS